MTAGFALHVKAALGALILRVDMLVFPVYLFAVKR